MAICGGHSLRRRDEMYGTLVELGNRIANSGFICVTGGGPGAMEASNMGAYLAGLHCSQGGGAEGLPAETTTDHQSTAMDDGQVLDEVPCSPSQHSHTHTPPPDRQHADKSIQRDLCNRTALDRAIVLIRSNPAPEDMPEYQHSQPAEAVLAEFGAPRCFTPSLGIPTWRYGHEPPNLFTGYHAKFFQNALREDILLQICFGGLIVTPGGPGTMQEIFQAACINAYAKAGYEYPIVFLGVSFWTSNGMWDMVTRLAAGRDYAHLLLLSDSVDEVMDHLMRSARQKGLHLMDDISELKNPYWYSRSLFPHDTAVVSTNSDTL